MELHGDMNIVRLTSLEMRKINNSDAIPISALKKDYSILIELLFKRLETMSVKVGTVYLDINFKLYDRRFLH